MNRGLDFVLREERDSRLSFSIGLYHSNFDILTAGINHLTQPGERQLNRLISVQTLFIILLKIPAHDNNKIDNNINYMLVCVYVCVLCM